MIFSNKNPKIVSKSEPYKTVIYSHVNSNKSNFFTEENWHILRSLNMIGKKMSMKFGFVSDPAHMNGMYKTLMQSAKKLKRTDYDIREAVDLWCINPIEAEEKYGHISDWDVSNVFDMGGIFSMAHSFNQPIGNWNVSKVSDMSLMFGCAYVFNQTIGNWNISPDCNISGMFVKAHAFNQAISN